MNSSGLFEHYRTVGLKLVVLAVLMLPLSLHAQSSPPLPGEDRLASRSASEPLSDEQRVRWFLDSTLGAKSLGVGVVSAGWGTARNNPEEYGPHWGGFGKRYAMRLSGVATGNAIEAGLGKWLGEDPRYTPSTSTGVWGRIAHAAKMTVFSGRAGGEPGPAYSRYAGIVGNNFLSNAWREESERSRNDALTRSATGFAGKFTSNLFEEFFQDVVNKFRRK